jgi:serine/threonine protein kinase
MELDILHKSTSEDIVEFYGAFFIESCVYYCMEYMDCGSLDKLYGDGVPEDVLAKIAISVRMLRKIGRNDGVQRMPSARHFSLSACVVSYIK